MLPSCFTVDLSVLLCEELPVALTSSSRPGPCPCTKPRHPTALLVPATEAGSQHSFHVFVLCSVLSVAQALRLLALLAATRGSVVTAGAVSTTLMGRNRVKQDKNLTVFT